MKYLRDYLKIAPAAHALWRALETREISKIALKRPILDLGCGYGEFAGVFYNSSVEMGIDVSGRDLQWAAKTKKYSQLVLADARKMPFAKSSFATVLSVSVIEHIPNTQKVLDEAYRVLVPGGSFVFTTPSLGFTKYMFFPRVFRFLMIEPIAKFYEDSINRIFKHCSLYEEEDWRRMLKKSGFEIDKLELIIPQKIVTYWDLLLLPALPSQLTKILFGKRLVLQNKLRIELAYLFLKKIIRTSKGRGTNFLIVAKKPKVK